MCVPATSPSSKGKDYHTAQTMAGLNFGGFRTVRKLVEKILAAGHNNISLLFKLTTFGG